MGAGRRVCRHGRGRGHQAKVAELELAMAVDQDVLDLDVAVHKLEAVHLVDGKRNVPHDGEDLVLAELLAEPGVHVLEKRLVRAELHEHQHLVGAVGKALGV